MRKITCAYSSLSCMIEGQSSNLVINQGCLKTNPEERLTIDQVIQNKWVSVSEYFSSLSSTILQVPNISKWRLKPLGASSILTEDNVMDNRDVTQLQTSFPGDTQQTSQRRQLSYFHQVFRAMTKNLDRVQLNKSFFCSNTTRFRPRRC